MNLPSKTGNLSTYLDLKLNQLDNTVDRTVHGVLKLREDIRKITHFNIAVICFVAVQILIDAVLILIDAVLIFCVTKGTL